MSVNDEFMELLHQIIAKGSVSIVEDDSKIFDIINENYEFIGSKIDWSRTRNHWSEKYNFSKEGINLKDKYKNILKSLINNNFNEIIKNENGIYYISDYSLSYGLEIEKSSFFDILKIIISNIPQHHYFTNPNGSWCLAITMEGYIDFGYST
ncbi:hypothetical protein [Delftia acidovorans]|uniref:hypothetical protein n=1 Tax=Delftia acidovorans TaxID=80866 RepID=UPI00301A662F